MKIHILVIAFTATLLISCGEDFFEQTVPVKVPEHTPRLAVTAQLAAGDTALRVFVTHSLGILENGQAQFIKDATVGLFKEGQLLANIPYDSEWFYKTTLPQPLPGDMSNYQLKVSAPGYDAVEAVQQMPVAVSVLSATYEVEGAVDENGDKVDELTVEFQDPAGEENFYALSAWLEFDSLNSYMVYFTNLDPLAEDLNGTLVIQDDSFDGKKYKWRFSASVGNSPGSKMRIQLRSISKDKYLFLKSASLSEENDDNPFAEPVIIHNNIEGGYGIFSLEARSVMVIEL